MPRDALQLELQQGLQQTLSPLQFRYARMLEMTEPEVEEEVSRELDDNPALEAAPVAEIPAYRLNTSNTSADDPRFEPQIADSAESLADHLRSQLGELSLSPRRRAIAEMVIGNLDSNGYLRRSPDDISDDIAVAFGADVEPAEVRDMVNVIRGLDPSGVGAYDLRDCLLLQLRATEHTDAPHALAREIVAHYFDIFSKKHYERLRSALGVDEAALRRAEQVIKGLNPKPGAGYGDTDTASITPDFLYERDEHTGRATLSMPNRIPDLHVAETFSPEAETGTAAEAAEFVRRKRDEATSFIKVLKMRQATLMRIMRAIISIQSRFFASEDPADLKPMVLKDIAAITGDDLSVISRATMNKYVATPTNIYPLKQFFSEHRADRTEGASEGSEGSLHSLLEALRALIAEEDKKHPLSDEALTAAMHDRGYDIARRTVAKYRERLGIPVARLRKRL